MQIVKAGYGGASQTRERARSAHLLASVIAALSTQLSHAAAPPLRPIVGTAAPPSATNPRQKFAQTLNAVVQPNSGKTQQAGVSVQAGGITKWFAAGMPASAPSPRSPAAGLLASGGVGPKHLTIPQQTGPSPQGGSGPSGSPTTSSGDPANNTPASTPPADVPSSAPTSTPAPTPDPGMPDTTGAQTSAYPGQPATYPGGAPPPSSSPGQGATYPGGSSPPSAYPGQATDYSNGPSLASTYPGQATTYPGSPAPASGYPGQATTYPGGPLPTSAYPDPSASYPGTPSGTSAYPGQTTTYPGSAPPTPGYSGQNESYPGDLPATSSYPGQAASYPGGSADYQYPSNGYPSNGDPATLGSNTSGLTQASSFSGYSSTDLAQPGGDPGASYNPGASYGSGNSYDSGASGSALTGLYAGMAYEVHTLARDGSSTPVDPASHPFRTGDRFVVYYRPSMPGRVDVFNINPQGQKTAIDTTSVPGGQLVTLGPYEFTDSGGDESLRLVLTPCGSSALMAATRDIVKVNGPAGASGLALPSCGAPGTRGLKARTRDIRKMQTDGGTNYALDPVSQQEVVSGQYASRQTIITFHHQ